MGALEYAAGILALLLVVVGPGSGLYIGLKKAMNGQGSDIAEIKADLKRYGDGAHTDRVVLLRAVDRLDRMNTDVTGLLQASHDHANQITALNLKVASHDPPRPG